MSSLINDYPITSITSPGSNDILCGRGGGTNSHPGNIKFRKLVAAHKLRYLAASKSDKPGVARDVVREWRGMDPPGRFLTKMDMKNTPPHHGDEEDRPVYWSDVGDKKAREKASQCLRERNGAANEAVAALVKTVTASGEACPEDYATLMNKAALVKAQNDLMIQQQNEMIKMNQVQEMRQQQMEQMNSRRGNNAGNNNNMGGGGGPGSNNAYCQEAFEPISLNQQQGQGNSRGGYPSSSGGGDNSVYHQETNAEDDLIEAEIQRLLQERQHQLMASNNQNNSQGGRGGGLSNSGRSAGVRGMGGGMSNNNTVDLTAPQPYMGEESVLREYEQLMQKQRELNMLAGNLGNNGMNNNGMAGGMMNNMGGMMNNNMSNNMMPQAAMSNSMGMNNMGGMNNTGMGNSNYGGGNGNQMNNPMGGNPDAAKDYMTRLRLLRQGGGGGNSNNVPDQATSNSSGGYNNNNGYSVNAGIMGNTNNGVGGVGSDNTMNSMMNNMQQQMVQGNTNSKKQEDFTIEEYQASLQQFLSHNDDFGGSSSRDNKTQVAEPDLMPSREFSNNTQHAGNLTNNNNNKSNTGNNPYNISGAGAIQCIQVPTNLDDGNGGKRNRRSSLRAVDDMDLHIGRNTFKSVDSAERPSFQSSMDDMDIRGTFKSVDTMDLMSIGNSINEIMDDDIKQNPDMRKKYGRRLSNAASRSGGYSKGGGGVNVSTNPVTASLSEFAQLPGQTLEIKTMDHGQGGRGSGAAGGGGSEKKKSVIDPRLVGVQGGTRQSVQTKDCDGPSGNAGMGRGSQLSIQNLMDGATDDASRMSFGNMSVMSEMTDFQEMMARGHGDSFNQL